MSDEYKLDKLIWTEDDFERINLDSAYVYAYAEQPAKLPAKYWDLLPKPLRGSEAEAKYKANPPTNYWGRELVFDVDYYFRRSDLTGQPQQPSDYTNWLSPATLVFEQADIIEMYINYGASILRTLKRYQKQPAPEDALPGWMWLLTADFGSLRLNATGIKLYFRKQPVISDSFALGFAERGGWSFSREVEE